MKKSYSSIFLFLFLAGISCTGQALKTEMTFIGPANGTLIILGGGDLGESLIRKFIAIGGGLDVPFVVIPTADGGQESYDENFGEAGLLRKLGATNVKILHTTNREIANSDSFVQPLVNAKVVWFSGGRQWRLVDAYKNTLTEKMLWKVLENGGVIGGSSAGATIQGSYLTRGDTKNNQIMMGDHEEGFGFIKNVAIDQHVLARNRHFDMLEILNKRPELLGIGIDERTGIIVTGNQFEVIGDSYVVIYDNKFWSREGSDLKKLPENTMLFYFLRAGDKYDILNRKVIR
jgi:cyanophycinase